MKKKFLLTTDDSYEEKGVAMRTDERAYTLAILKNDWKRNTGLRTKWILDQDFMRDQDFMWAQILDLGPEQRYLISRENNGIY